ncbi:MAG: methenyltetrahydromethanopterin cyclohydrolase [Planctomycetaceae bacterium]|nr:methenyltetrahydromethanopterin cyclohydrolase [Planctomycetaceae bacterium]
MSTLLNARAWDLVHQALESPGSLRGNLEELACGARLLDLGVKAQGSLEAGLLLSRACTSGLAEVSLEMGNIGSVNWPMVQVTTDFPVQACLLSQYAGWEIKTESYFAMGSGPMRANAGREELFQQLNYTEQSSNSVGILEADSLPNSEVVREIATKANVDPQNLILLVASTASLAGNLQINARVVETALHKLHELHFDVTRIVSATGIAPVSPVASNTLAAIGRTNDAILYGGQVTLYVQGDDESIEQIGPKVPSSASSDYGKPFEQTFRDVNCDFYQIDPMLFSPAQIVFQNIDTGQVHWFGETNEKLLKESFGIQEK